MTDYMLGRTYYFPLSRFGSVDPARDGWNLYGYVGGNPVNAVDPDGRQSAEIRMDQRIQLLLTGQITQEQLLDQYTADAIAAGVGVAIVGALYSGPYILGAALNPEVNIPATLIAGGLLGVESAGPISVSAGLSRTNSIRSGLSVGKDRTVAFAKVAVDGLYEEVIAVSGRAFRGASHNGARVVGNTARTGPGRLDAEVKILDDVASRLTPDSAGTIDLFVDKAACSNCGAAILAFRQSFPNINLTVSAP